MFDFIVIYSFIPVSCVDRGPGAPLCPWVYNAVKTVLNCCNIVANKYKYLGVHAIFL